MAKKKHPFRRKIRTREHIVADLAVNHVEKQALLGGGTIEHVTHDYGIDLVLFTYTAAGVPENSIIFLQIKGTEELKWLKSGQKAAFRLTRADLVGWLDELLPVMLIVYDAKEDRAHWLHVQGHFAAQPGLSLFTAGTTVTIHLDASQLLDAAAIRTFAEIRDVAKK